MAIQIIVNAANAATDSFTIISAPQNSFSVDAKVSGVVGSPTWSLMVSNVGTTESDFKYYSTDTTAMAITTAIESNVLPFEFIAVKYTSNGSTGLISFYKGE